MKHDVVGIKPPFVFWGCFWGLGATIAIVSLGADFIIGSSERLIGRDFMNLWVAGKLVLEGQPWCPFDPDCFRLGMMNHLDVANLQNYSYPPHALFLAVPFALVPYYIALALWSLAGAAFFIWAARPWLPRGFAPYLAALTPAATLTIWNGHYGLFFGGLWLLFFRLLNHAPTKAGVIAGALTFKPHLGIMIAVASLRNWRTLGAAGLSLGALVIASSLAFGLVTWADFFFATTAEQAVILTRPTDHFYFRMMTSAYVTFGRGTVGIVAQIAAAAAIVMLARRPRLDDPFVAATATFVIVPYAFNYDMTVACLGFAVLLWKSWGSLSRGERSALAVAFMTPQLSYFAPWLIPPALLLALHIQLNREPSEAI